MLKFLRKYQKWMLVIFCAALMLAFLVPQAAQQFVPNPVTATMATTYDGQPINQELLRATSRDLQMLRRLRIEPIPGLSLLPQNGSESDDAYTWIMIQRAAEHNGLGASDQEAFNLIASVLGLEDFDSLETRARELGANAAYLMQLGKQYLKAEQYRQLIAGIEYTLPEGDSAIGSPGMRRVAAMSEALLAAQRSAQQTIQQFQQFAPQQLTPQLIQQLEFQALQGVMGQGGYLEKIQGHERVTATELRYALQRVFSELDLTVVVLGADDRLDTTTVDDEYVRQHFERFAGDVPGTGDPFGLGYREPDKAKFEALRIPIDQVRASVAASITPEQVRRFYNANREALAADLPLNEDGTLPEITLTPDLRDSIRVTLTEIGAAEKVDRIALEARQRLNEVARGLADEGVYKKLPDDFAPISLGELAEEIKAKHGIEAESILIDDFVSSQDLIDAAQFTQNWVSKMPTATVKIPNEQFGFLVDTPVPQTVLGGRAGLFSATVPALSEPNQRPVRLADYLTIARPFLEPEQQENVTLALQPMLPGEVLRDMTGSTYVFRITETQPSRPATDMTPIAETVREEAKRVKAYQTLAEEQAALLDRAASSSIESLMPSADAKTTLSGLTRQTLNQQFGAQIEGVSSTRPILERAFQIADDLIAAGTIRSASESERLFAVELPGDYRLALVRIDTFRPMTRAKFEEEAAKPSMLMLATGLGATSAPEPPLSMEAMMRYTGFKWADGYGPDSDDGFDEDEDEDEDAEAEDDAA
ncbi:MAG: hypothetical protein ACPGYV_12445 [Phycisphaeraceae bacterium]